MYILYRLYRVLNNGCYICEKIMKYIDKIFHFTTQYNAKLPDAYGIALYFIKYRAKYAAFNSFQQDKTRIQTGFINFSD
jgi:hypothetical protein